MMMPLTVIDAPMMTAVLPENERRPNTTTIKSLETYDIIIVSFSGGKDSIALVLHLLAMGVPKCKIQLWHQVIDGEPDAKEHFMDWPCTESYCRAFAKALGLRILFQWRHGGFKGEMLKKNARTQAVSFERQDGTIGTAGGKRGKISTRFMYPQQTADLSVRWCSASLKIDTMSMAINNEPTFKKGMKLLVVTGERREESTARSRYAEMEEHRCNTKSRLVDHWRVVIDWTEQEVWEIMRKNRIIPHPCYRLGFSRCSCMKCIFIGQDEWATNQKIDPTVTQEAAGYEVQFGKTIRRGRSIQQQIAKGTAFPESNNAELVSLAMGRCYPEDQIILPEGVEWVIPAGAYKGGGCGPI
jgi:3'-phosphoadenosine 5'-phosphosulfate sulfotransferase (PAPS reductase)/FAD synthetase